MKKYFFRLIFVLLFVICKNVPTYADVSLANGNFYIGFTDILTSKDKNLFIERVYNSKSGFNGIFGIGWGTYYETHISVSASGELRLFQSGGGRLDRFRSIDRPEYYDSILVINRRETANFRFQRDSAAKKNNYNQKHKDSIIKSIILNYIKYPRSLDDDWDDYVSKSKTKLKIKTGEIFEENNYGEGTIIKTPQGYRRIVDKEKIEYYNDLGKLVQIEYTKNNKISFTYIYYNTNNLPESIVSSNGSSIYLFYNKYNKVERILSSDNEFAIYHYSTDKDFPCLIYSCDTGNNVYIFSYDSRYNMTEIKYSDHTKLTIEYAARYESVSKTVDRVNSVRTYDYKYLDSIIDHVIITVSVYDSQANKIRTNDYEYINGRRKI